MLALIVKVPTI